MIKPLNDPQGKATTIDLRDTTTPKFNLRMSEKLLCGDCETRISVYEGYLADLVFRPTYLMKKISDDVVQLSGLDYAKFKLFYLSVLWRGHASKLDFFTNINLGKKYSSHMASMLLAGDPGSESDYPLFLIKLYDDDPGLEVGLITQPVRTKFSGAKAYRAIFGGFDWNIAVTRQPGPDFQMHAIRLDGTINCMYKKVFEHDTVTDSVERYRKDQKRRSRGST